ncbi:MAG TPA: hypothetical protein VNT81_00085 [Vicinamibacterales bacterium]|nr:hypothetical protein [Vicinamibacterales bacterium]
MKSSSWLVQAVIAILLVGAGAILWRSSEYERRLAAAERDLVTLKYDDAQAAAAVPGGRLANLMPGAATAAEAKALESTAGYWRGEYDRATENPDAKLLAANAAFRKAREAGGSWQAVVGRFDTIVKQYAEILREDPNNADAAFNYEYVVRLRAVFAARKMPVPPLDAKAAGLSIHGYEGAPPEESDMKKFKMIVPMRPDERLEAEKAGKGATKVRKG